VSVIPTRLTQAAIESVFQVPDNDGVFKEAQRAYLSGVAGQRPMVFLAFAPKAAGTFLRQAAIEAVDGDLVRIVHAQGGRDAQPYMPTLIAYQLGGICSGPAVTHVHMQALPSNRHFLEMFRIRPVIMIRSIPDMLASYWDMIETDEAARRDGLNCEIPDDFPSRSKERKADFLVDIMGPWYASYYATWLGYAKSDPDRVLVLHYADFKADPVQTLSQILAHSGVGRSYEECKDAIDTAWREREELRFNKGEKGRGKTYFAAQHIERLARMLSHYPVTDESLDVLLGR
jgi:hypothetical protein